MKLVLVMKRFLRSRWTWAVLLPLGCGLGGCHTALVPLKPAAIGPPWAAKPGVASTRPGKPATGVRGGGAKTGVFATAPATTQGKWLANLHNSTSKTIDIASYHHIFNEALHLIRSTGYRIGWSSRRLGIIVSKPRIGPEVLQWWLRRRQLGRQCDRYPRVDIHKRRVRRVCGEIHRTCRITRRCWNN